MALHTTLDARGLGMTHASAAARDAYEHALTQFHSYFGNPLATIDGALAEAPDFFMGHALRAGMLLTSTEKAALPLAATSVACMETLAPQATDRERRHAQAARAWLDGEVDCAVARYGELLLEHPRDALALQLAHLGDFFLGQSVMLRDRVARVLPDWNAAVPGYGYVLGMHAFGLEETALYVQAEETAARALSLNRRDPWAVHAAAHVMEMQGRTVDGIAWLVSRTNDWAPDNAFAFHNWWHLALFHLDRGDTEAVLDLYDTRVRPQPSAVVLEMIDATALLWRLQLRGVPVGGRWGELADAWTPLAGDGHYAFNDAHAMMAFVAAGREHAAAQVLATLRRRALGADTNARMTRTVGLPLAEALQAFGQGRYDRAVEGLLAVQPVAARAGGSHAQRDVLHLTLIEAALRAGRMTLARALAAERVALKPSSPFNQTLAFRTRALAA